MNTNFKPLATALALAAFLAVAPAHAEEAHHEAAPSQAQGAPAGPQGMGGMMGPRMMGKPAAGSPSMSGNMDMMGMMQR